MLLLMPGVAAASSDSSALAAYARGRVAAQSGDTAEAVRSFGAALTLSQDAALVALRAYRAGMDGGDYALALRGARALDAFGVVPGDAKLLLYIAALRDRDWVEAERRLADIGRDQGFDFLAPLLGPWLSLATGKSVSGTQRTSAYSAANAAMFDLARGTPGSLASIAAALPSDPIESRLVDLAAAATAVRGGKRPSGAVDTPARGASFVLERMAWDLAVERSARSAQLLARLANFAAPERPSTAIVLVAALIVAERHAQALAMADTVRDAAYRPLTEPFVVDALEAGNRRAEAVAVVAAWPETNPDRALRLGDLAARDGRNADAAGYYRRALERPGAARNGRLWYALGNALDKAGDWPAARQAFDRAVQLDAGDPALLNHYAYLLARRGEALDKALDLATRAAVKAPGNAAIVDTIGWTHFRAGRIDAAIAALERARTLDPAEPDIAEHLGDVYWAAGRRVEARYVWTAAKSGRDGTDALRLKDKIARGPS